MHASIKIVLAKSSLACSRCWGGACPTARHILGFGPQPKSCLTWHSLVPRSRAFLPELWAVGVGFSHVILMLALYRIISTHNLCHFILSDPSVISRITGRVELSPIFIYFFILLRGLDKLVKKDRNSPSSSLPMKEGLPSSFGDSPATPAKDIGLGI